MKIIFSAKKVSPVVQSSDYWQPSRAWPDC